MFERIVVPLDGSRLSAQAIPYATEVGKRFGAEIILVRVISPDDLALVPEVQGVDNYNSTDMIQKEETDDVDNAAYAKRYLTNWSQSLKSQGVKVSYEVLVGNPAKAIMLFSKTQQASLIVGRRQLLLPVSDNYICRFPSFLFWSFLLSGLRCWAAAVR